MWRDHSNLWALLSGVCKRRAAEPGGTWQRRSLSLVAVSWEGLAEVTRVAAPGRPPFRMLRRTPKQVRPHIPTLSRACLKRGPHTGGERQIWGVVCFLNSASVSLPAPPRLPSASACSCLSLGFWWWKSSSLCEANDLPLCEAYWRLDLDTDSADGLSAPVLASPEPSAGPLQAAAPAHSHATGPGPTEHA